MTELLQPPDLATYVSWAFEVSRTEATRLIKGGAIQLNHQRVTANRIISIPGDHVIFDRCIGFHLRKGRREAEAFVWHRDGELRRYTESYGMVSLIRVPASSP